MKQLFTLVLMLVALTTFAQKATIYPVSGQPFKANIINIKKNTVRYHEVPDRSGLGQTYIWLSLYCKFVMD